MVVVQRIIAWSMEEQGSSKQQYQVRYPMDLFAPKPLARDHFVRQTGRVQSPPWQIGRLGTR